MKKVVALLLLVLCVPVFGIAESNLSDGPIDVLTIENCEELASILQLKDEFDDSIKEFAGKYAGQIIEFDGNIAYLALHGSYKTRYDILIYAGDYSETSISGPVFQFSDVGVWDLGLSGLELPAFVRIGSNVHVMAKVEEYKEASGLFMLDPVLISPRSGDKQQ